MDHSMHNTASHTLLIIEKMSDAIGYVEKNKEELKTLSEEIWKNPELGLEEHKAHKLLTEFLEKKGFDIDKGYCGMDTVFRARFINSQAVKLRNVKNLFEQSFNSCAGHCLRGMKTMI